MVNVVVFCVIRITALTRLYAAMTKTFHGSIVRNSCDWFSFSAAGEMLETVNHTASLKSIQNRKAPYKEMCQREALSSSNHPPQLLSLNIP